MNLEILNKTTDSQITELDKIAIEVLSKVKQRSGGNYKMLPRTPELSTFKMGELGVVPHIEESFGKSKLINLKDDNRANNRDKEDKRAKYDNLNIHKILTKCHTNENNAKKIEINKRSVAGENEKINKNNESLHEEILPNNIAKKSEHTEGIEENINKNCFAVLDTNVVNETRPPIVPLNSNNNGFLFLLNRKLKGFVFQFFIDLLAFLLTGNCKHRIFNIIILMVELLVTIFLAILSLSICIIQYAKEIFYPPVILAQQQNNFEKEKQKQMALSQTSRTI